MKTIDKRKNVKKFNLANFLAILFMTFFLVLVIGSFVYPVDPDQMNASSKFLGPSTSHPFGTDHFGRDVLARVMHGSRSVLSIGIASSLIACISGGLVGIAAGMASIFVRRCLMAIVDGLTAFPGLLLAMLVVFVLGRGTLNTVIAISIVEIPVFSKITYSAVLSEKNKLHIQAAKTYGMTKTQIVRAHILPAITPKLITQLSSSIAKAIMTESSLSFLGLGVQPPGISLGLMLKEAQKYALLRPSMIMPAGVTLIIIVLAFVITADLISDEMLKKGGFNG